MTPNLKSDKTQARRFSVFNAPNALSVYRIAAAPLILYSIFSGHRMLFAWLVIINLVTDALDVPCFPHRPPALMDLFGGGSGDDPRRDGAEPVLHPLPDCPAAFAETCRLAMLATSAVKRSGITSRSIIPISSIARPSFFYPVFPGNLFRCSRTGRYAWYSSGHVVARRIFVFR